LVPVAVLEVLEATVEVEVEVEVVLHMELLQLLLENH
jgi:hypothetical protein